MNFEFSTAERILFGQGKIQQAGSLAAEIGRRALVVTGMAGERPAALLELLDRSGVEFHRFTVGGEPTVALIRRGVQQARETACELVIAFGGGSALDAGKAIAILARNDGDVLDYLEVIGKGQALREPPLPYITIPTTAGTGAEVTRNAVLGSPEHRVKVSVRSPLLKAHVALVDPELTASMPPGVTASTGLDALTQLIEPYVSNQANPMTDALCREGMQRAARSLRRAYEDGSDLQARQDMSLASLLSGIALANAKLGIVHGMASVLGGALAAPHGVICARLLPYAMVSNVTALQDRAPGSEALQRYNEIARLLTGRATARARDGVAWVQELSSVLNVPPLGTYGLAARDFPDLIEKSQVASSTKGNPVKLTPAEMEEILAKAM